MWRRVSVDDNRILLLFPKVQRAYRSPGNDRGRTIANQPEGDAMPANNPMSYSDHGLNITKSFEGLRTTAYQDQGGVWTLGFGHTAGVRGGMTCTQEQADAWIDGDVAHSVRAVNGLVSTPITQNQFDALVDFAFNLGSGALAGSELLRKVNAGDMEGAALEFLRWDHVHGTVVKGLTRRRQAEAALFREGM